MMVEINHENTINPHHSSFAGGYASVTVSEWLSSFFLLRDARHISVNPG